MLAVSILVGLLVMAVAIPARLDLGNRMRRWVHGDPELILKVAAELEEADHHVRDMTLAKVPTRWFTWKYRLRFLGMLAVALAGWSCGIDNWWVAVTVGLLLGLQGALDAFLMPLVVPARCSEGQRRVRETNPRLLSASSRAAGSALRGLVHAGTIPTHPWRAETRVVDSPRTVEIRGCLTAHSSR